MDHRSISPNNLSHASSAASNHNTNNNTVHATIPPNLSRFRTNTYSHSSMLPDLDFDGLLLSDQRPNEPQTDVKLQKKLMPNSSTGGIKFDLARVSFERQNKEKDSGHAPPPGFGRRRSKSQGQLLPGRSLYDYDPFGLLDDDDKLEGSNDDDIERILGENNNTVEGRKWASSFHAFDSNDTDSDLDNLLGRSSKNSLAHDDNNLLTARLDELNILSTARDRAGTDFGRYASYRNVPQQPEHEPRTLRGNSNASPSMLLHEQQNTVNSINQTMNTVSQLNHINQQLMYRSKGSSGSTTPINTLDPQAYMAYINGQQHYNNSQTQSRHSAGSNKGDWICVACGNTNYSWRHVCNMRKCRAPKPGHLSMEPSPPGSWACLSCGNLNYAERVVCNMRKCRAPRPGTTNLQAVHQHQMHSNNQFMHSGQMNLSNQINGDFNGYSPKMQYLMQQNINMGVGYSGFDAYE